MIIWINGSFGVGKSTMANELYRRIPNSFLYDPEEAGYFIRKNIPLELHKSDFQDHVMWREINLSMLRNITCEYAGIIIVPMTIVNPIYFEELVGGLRASRIIVRHFTLMAQKQTILKRLESRGESIDSWAAQQIDRCLENLSNEMFEKHIYTDDLNSEQIAQKIALECAIELENNQRE